MVWRLPPPRIRPQPVGIASRSTSDAAEASVDRIRFMVRPRDGVIWRGLRCQMLVTPSDSRVASVANCLDHEDAIGFAGARGRRGTVAVLFSMSEAGVTEKNRGNMRSYRNIGWMRAERRATVRHGDSTD